ncbi:hypothetical protein HZA97_01660 [Candidatus Woesearchaeota archaeon]|nr:hypothetical protein [Candidatus Woesearchaeota archaeon]
MKITIDTKLDSKEEIRRAVELLNNLMGTRNSSEHRNIFDDNTSSSVSNPLNMFDTSNSSPPPSSSSSSSNAFNSMFNNEPELKEEKNDDNDDSVPEIEFY